MDSQIRVTITEPAGGALADLRADSAARRAIGQYFGGPLPDAGDTGTLATAQVLGIGPDHWWLRLDEGALPALETALRQACAGGYAALTEISDAQVTFRIAAPSRDAIEQVLAQGCPLDLSAEAFPAGDCAGTVLGRVAVVLVAGPGAIDLLVDRTHAAWCRAWLGNASSID